MLPEDGWSATMAAMTVGRSLLGCACLIAACGEPSPGPGEVSASASTGEMAESSGGGEEPTTNGGTTTSSGTTEDGGTGGATGTTGTGGSESSSGGETGEGEPVYPVPDWEVEPPEEHGFDAAGLMAMATQAEQMDSNCLVVTQGGVIVGEWYWNEFTPEKDQDNVYSVTKSITSALVGIAAGDGALDIEDAAGFPEWAGTDSEAVTIRNLISNDSGREWSFTSDYVQMGLQPDQTQYAIDLGHAQPVGSLWEYNNAAIQTVQRALGTAIGGDVGDYAQQRLFAPIGMSAAMGRDGSGQPLTYQGVSASCRDLARFGYLYLRGGVWAGGVQVVPGEWVAASLQPSTALNTAYGFMWWLNRPGHWILPSVPLRTEGDGKLLPQAPDAVYAAVGAFGQYVVVDPTRDVVWVRLGPTDLGDASGFGKLGELWDAYSAAQSP